jgi:hypothetical protein
LGQTLAAAEYSADDDPQATRDDWMKHQQSITSPQFMADVKLVEDQLKPLPKQTEVNERRTRVAGLRERANNCDNLLTARLNDLALWRKAIDDVKNGTNELEKVLDDIIAKGLRPLDVAKVDVAKLNVC